MGEAKRREAARINGQPWVPPRICPNCRSPRVHRSKKMVGGLSKIPTLFDVCFECHTIWEAYSEGWCEDVVGAEPCDNCAFRPGVPEHQDKEAWAKLIADLKGGREFKCHKGCPIVTKGKEIIGFDEKWIEARGRNCAGFMRMVWSMKKHGEDWLANRYRILGVGEGNGKDE